MVMSKCGLTLQGDFRFFWLFIISSWPCDQTVLKFTAWFRRVLKVVTLPYTFPSLKTLSLVPLLSYYPPKMTFSYHALHLRPSLLRLFIYLVFLPSKLLIVVVSVLSTGEPNYKFPPPVGSTCYTSGDCSLCDDNGDFNCYPSGKRWVLSLWVCET